MLLAVLYRNELTALAGNEERGPIKQQGVFKGVVGIEAEGLPLKIIYF